MTVSFTNKGLIDLKAVKTFGASSKETSNAIGFFGTGLKYAIAILLREGCEVELLRGAKRHKFSVRKTKIRVDHFDLIYMDDEPLAFTTELGKTWELWQAFRELLCNAIDEGGHVSQGRVSPTAGHTSLVVTGDAFDTVYATRSSIMLVDSPDLVLRGVEVLNRRSDYLYFRGVRVMELEHPSRMTYNITQKIDLTEDRTVRYSWQALSILKVCVATSTDVEFIKRVLTAGEETFEHKFDFGDLSTSPGSVFLHTSELVQGTENVNASAMRILRKALRNQLEESDSTVLAGVPAQQLERALAFCTDIGFKPAKVPIIVVEELDENAKSLVSTGKVFLSSNAFVEGTRPLTLILIDALLRHEMGTFTTGDQRADRLTTMLTSLGEKLQGEPL